MKTIGIIGSSEYMRSRFCLVGSFTKRKNSRAIRLKCSGREILHQPVIDPCNRHFYSINIGMIEEPEPVGRPGDNMALLRTLLIPTNNRVRDPVVGVRTYARPRLNPAGFVNLIHILVFASYGYRPSPAFIKFSLGSEFTGRGATRTTTIGSCHD